MVIWKSALAEAIARALAERAQKEKAK